MDQKSFIGYCSAFVKDHPGEVNLGLLLIVAVHFALDKIAGFPHIWAMLQSAPLGEQVSIYLAVLSVSAVVAGFAGVVVVFGLSSQPQAFRRLRAQAGSALTRNWISVSNSGFISSGLALISVLVLYSAWKPIAVWFFELAILVCCNGVLRLLWLLKSLIRIVQADDIRLTQQEGEKK